MSTRSLVADHRVFTAGLVHRLCDTNPNALNSQRTKERQTLEITLGMATPTDTLVLSYGGWKSHGRATRDLGNHREKSHQPNCSWTGSTPNSYDILGERLFTKLIASIPRWNSLQGRRRWRPQDDNLSTSNDCKHTTLEIEGWRHWRPQGDNFPQVMNRNAETP